MTKNEILDKVNAIFASKKDIENATMCDYALENFLDLHILYTYPIGRIILRLDNSTIKRWGITMEELHKHAMENMRDKLFVKTMWDLVPDGIPDKEQNMKKMYVGSNENAYGGAIVMLYPEKFRGLSEKLKSDLLLLPSSIHEIIIVLVSEYTVEDVRNLVREMNNSELIFDECFLSDSIYKYRYAQNDIVKITD